MFVAKNTFSLHVTIYGPFMERRYMTKLHVKNLNNSRYEK